MDPRDLPVSRLQTVLGDAPRTGRSQWLADALVASLVDGRLPEDARLPSERALAVRLGLSRGTVVRALDAAKERGFLVSRQGSGRFLRLPREAARPLEPLQGDLAAAPPGAVDLRSTLLPPHPALRAAALAEAAAVETDPSWGSAPVRGLPELIRAICEHFAARGLPTAEDQVLVTAGAVSGLHLALAALTASGDRVGTEDPGYPNTAQVIRGLDRWPVPIPVVGDHGRALEDAVGSGELAAAVLTPDFHNPTGRLLSEGARERLVRAAARAGTVLVIDETLAGTNWRGLPMHRPVAAFGGSTGTGPGSGSGSGSGSGEAESTVVTVGSASKTLWNGLRIGWIRADAQTIETIARRRTGVDLGAPVLEQRIAARLLPVLSADGVTVHAERLSDSWEQVRAALEEHAPHWSAIAPDGGLSVWCTGLRRPSSALVEEAGARGVLLTPGALFAPGGADGTGGRPAQGWPGALRLPISASPQDLVAAIAVLGELDRA
ncbi:PLP-dependent aminotransferase family protein [Brachybacterium sp. NPDC056505]|uniref:aminotransferase-like domain-containing protein n=1 Tax=Brachybacterium sp. NPDC056505 TaxID=3345843 RepID=UPI00366AC55A